MGEMSNPEYLSLYVACGKVAHELMNGGEITKLLEHPLIIELFEINFKMDDNSFKQAELKRNIPMNKILFFIF